MRALVALTFSFLLASCVNFEAFRLYRGPKVSLEGCDDCAGGPSGPTGLSGSEPGPSGCVPETDAAFCTRTGRVCGPAPTALDNCGLERALVSCGGCSADRTCTNNACVCAQTDLEFCDAARRSCGAHTASDACGEMRSTDCGMCAFGASCSAGNCTTVCGAPWPTQILAQTDVGLTGNRTYLMGATPELDTLLVDLTVPSGTCSDDRSNHLLRFADLNLGAYTIVTINDADLAEFDVRGDESLTLLGDRHTIVGFSSDRTKLISKRRTSAAGVTPAVFAEAAITLLDGGLGAGPYAPAISADGKVMLYTDYGVSGLVQERVLYSSRRTATEPFSAPADVTEAFTVSALLYRPTGVSVDGATVFARDNTTTFYFHRPTPFDPYAPVADLFDPAPVGLSGFRTKPNSTCTRFISSYTSTDCAGIRVFTQDW